MDLAKFIAMLQQKGLNFSRADKFDDRFEGATGLAAKQADWDNFYLDHFREVVVTPPPGHPTPKLSAERIEVDAARLLNELKAVALEARNLLVSCWHISDTEAEALWRLYSPPGTIGVAVRSTIEKLWKVCADQSGAIVGRVHYLNYKKSFASVQKERIFQKRKSLSHEQEARIVLPNVERSPVEGMTLMCNLDDLISKVVISPFAPTWSVEVIGDVVKKYGYSFDMNQSELLDEPFF